MASRGGRNTVADMLFRRRKADPLRRCPACRSKLACPTGWSPEDDAHWHVELRCPECEHRWETLMPDSRAARFDLELDADNAAIMRTIRKLDHELMAHDAETFCAALARDLIEPADFAR